MAALLECAGELPQRRYLHIRRHARKKMRAGEGSYRATTPAAYAARRCLERMLIGPTCPPSCELAL